MSVYLIIKGCNYCSVKVIKLWCQKDREGGILLGGTWSYLICTFVSPIFKGVLLSYGFLLKAMPITSSFLTLQQKFKVKYNKACCPQTQRWNMQKWKHISKSNNNWLQFKSTKTMNTSIWSNFSLQDCLE